MNEKIKQLAMQAGTIEQTGPELWSDNQVEKFAELIVKECLSIVKLAHGEGNEDTYSYDEALEHAESNLRDHFGIE